MTHGGTELTLSQANLRGCYELKTGSGRRAITLKIVYKPQDELRIADKPVFIG